MAETKPDPAVPAPPQTSPAPAPEALPEEKGGRNGPEPTRYGDWEKGGIAVDF